MQAPVVAISVIRVSIAVMWLLSPPVLVAFALRDWRSSKEVPRTHFKIAMPLIAASMAFANWILFVVFCVGGQVGGFGTHYVTTRLADVFLVFSLSSLIASGVSSLGRWKLCTGQYSCIRSLVLSRYGGSALCHCGLA
jgi:hypothetical protein